MPKHALRGAPLYMGDGVTESDVPSVLRDKRNHPWQTLDGNAPTSAHVGDSVKAGKRSSLCSILYDSWGGDPPLSHEDMLLFEYWRCRTLAMRTLGLNTEGNRKTGSTSLHYAPSNNKLFSAPTTGCSTSSSLDDSAVSIIPTDHSGYAGTACLKGAMRQQAELRRVGFELVKEALPRGVPMDLVERTAWSECLSFFCKQEFFEKSKCAGSRDRCANFNLLRPVALPALVDRLSLRLWFLSPIWASAGPVGSSPPFNQLPGWLSFFCEEVAAFFLFLLLHMRLVLQQGDPQYLHLTDKEWNARFRHVSWLLSSEGPVWAFAQNSPFAKEMKGRQEIRSVESGAHTAVSALLSRPQRSTRLIPSFQDLEPACSFHFPPNTRTCPHEYWLLYDKVRYSWLVCDETAVIARFPVLETDTPMHGYSLKVASSPELEAAMLNSKDRRPGGSLVRAAQKDALRFLTLLGATNFSGLAIEDFLVHDLLVQAGILCAPGTKVTADTSASDRHFSGSKSTNGRVNGKRASARLTCLNRSSSTAIGIPSTDELTEKECAQSVQPPTAEWEQKMARWAEFDLEFSGAEPQQKRNTQQFVQVVKNTPNCTEERLDSRETTPHIVDSFAVEGSRITVAGHNPDPKPEDKNGKEHTCTEQNVPVESVRSDAEICQPNHAENMLPSPKESSGNHATDQEIETIVTTENTESSGLIDREAHGRKSATRGQSKRTQLELESTGSEVKRTKRHAAEGGEPLTKHSDNRSGVEQEEARQFLGSQLDRMELSGGRVLKGLRHRNTLIDRRLTAFVRAHRGSNGERSQGPEDTSVDGPVTLQQCTRVLQQYMGEHCTRLKKSYVCDSALKELTGTERLPQRKEALVSALKALHLIEYFMIDPRDSWGTG